jgi:cytochrome P450
VKTEISNRVVRRITGDGLVVVDGVEHRRQRKIITPAFAGHHVNHLVNSFWLKACELRDFWQVDAVGKESRYDVLGSLTRTTLDIIGLTGILHV